MKKCFFLMLIIFLCLVNSIAYSKIENRESNIYPKLLYRNLKEPYIWLDFGNYAQIRDARTGMLVNNINYEKDESVPVQLLNGEMVAYKDLGDGKQEATKINHKGKRESHTFIGSFIVWTEKPISFVKEYDDNADYLYQAYSADDLKLLWERKAKQNEFVDIFSTFDTLWQKEKDKISLLDPYTGKIRRTIQGNYNLAWLSQGLTLLSSKNKENQKHIIVDTRFNTIVYQQEFDDPRRLVRYYTQGDEVFEVLFGTPSNTFQGRKEKCELKRIALNGEIKGQYTFDLPPYQESVDWRGGISFVHDSFIFNWSYNPSRLNVINYMSNTICARYPLDNGYAFRCGENIIIGSSDGVMGIDLKDFSARWRFDAPQRIDEKEINGRKYVASRVYDKNDDCYALKVKVVNLIDNSVEPYEYFVSPMPGMSACICPTDYGVLFIPMASWPGKGFSIKLMRPGVPEPIYSITGEDHIFKEWKYTDNKDIIELISYSDKKAMFSVPDGVLTWTASEEK